MALLDAVICLLIGLLVVANVTDGMPAPNSGNSIRATKSFPSLKITNGKEKHDWNYKQTWYNALKSYTDLGKLLYGHFKKVLKDDNTSSRVLESTAKHADNNLLSIDRIETEVIASLKNQTASGSTFKNKQDIVRGKENKGDISQNEMVNTAGKTNIKPKKAGLNLNRMVSKEKKSVSKSGGDVIESNMNEAVDNSVRRQSDADYAYRSPTGKEIDKATAKLNENQGHATLSGSKNNQDVIANTYVDTVETQRSFKDRSQHVINKNDARTNTLLLKTDPVPNSARIATTTDINTLDKDQTAEHLTGYVSKATVLSTPQGLSPLKHDEQNTNQAPDGPSGFLSSEIDVLSAHMSPGIWMSSERTSKTLENLPSLDPNVTVFNQSEVVLYPQTNSVNASGHRVEEIPYDAHDIIDNTFTNSQLVSQNPKEDTTKADKVGIANHMTKSILSDNVIENSRSNLSWDTTGDTRETNRDPVLIINGKLDSLEKQTFSVNQSNQLETTSSTDNQAGKTVNNGNGTHLSKHSETEITTKQSIGNTTESNVLNGTTTSNLSKIAVPNQSNETTPIERTIMEAYQTSENMTYRTDVDTTSNSTTPSENVQEKPSSQTIQKVHKSSQDSLRDGYGNRRNSNKYNDDSYSEET